jgi:hypothetical protein
MDAAVMLIAFCSIIPRIVFYSYKQYYTNYLIIEIYNQYA